jgi:hypothetical protein
MPSLIALENISSVQVPAPVSLSGVMLGATRRASFVSYKMTPLPRFDSMGGKPGLVVSRGEWHVIHIRMPLVRYSPRLIRAAVDSNFTSLSGRVLVAISIVLFSSSSVAHLDKQSTPVEKINIKDKAFARVVMAVAFWYVGEWLAYT